MRRILAVMAVGTVLALTACQSLPAGVDGDLVNSWQAVPAPQTVRPNVGDCYLSTDPDMTRNKPIPCTSSHDVEVAFVGDLPADVAGASSPPGANSSGISEAYKMCYSPTNTYLGAEWHSGLVELTVTVPDTAAWGGGAHWFRCDVRATTSIYMGNDEVKSVTQSLKGALRTKGAFSLQCVTWVENGDFVNHIAPSSCKKFNGEFVGFAEVGPRAFPKDSEVEKLFSDACSAKVARYLGVSFANYTNQTVGWLWMNPVEDSWNSGDRSVRCFAAAYTSSHYFTASVKGIGNRNAKG